MITLLIQLLTLFSDKDVSIIDKIRFVPLLIFSLIFPGYDKQLKRTAFIDGNSFYYLGSHKNLILDHLISHLNVYKKYYLNAHVIIDVGASFGTFARTVTYFNPSAKIYCIEMAQNSYEILKLNTKSLERTKCFNYALGDRKHKIKYFYNELYPEGSLINGDQKSNSSVEMITLDNFIRQNKINKISLLKIDTEGFEHQILNGAKSALKISDFLIIEIEFSKMNLVRVEKLLLNMGFEIVNIGEINFDSQTNRIGSCDLVFKNMTI